MQGERPTAFAYSLRALGRGELPDVFCLSGVPYRHERTVKHDFWAATGFYLDETGRRVVLKINRPTEFTGMPLDWIGRWLCRREVRFYRALSDLPNIPRLLGRLGQTGFVHEYVEGTPIAENVRIPDGFFVELRKLLEEIHRRDIAYVDTNKSPNILLGADGRPHLIDFQISWDLHELGNTPLNRWWLHRLQLADHYHALKHRLRLRPDELSDEDRAACEKRSAIIRLHRFVTAPYRKIRRTMFKKLRESGRLLPEGSA